MGGEISVASREGEGATFTILLPADKAPVEQGQETSRDVVVERMKSAVRSYFWNRKLHHEPAHPS
jgi:hypothetical protein